MALRIIPLELVEANALVGRLHRHHRPVQFHRFSIGVVDGCGQLVGAAIVGRPVARLTPARTTLEVSRLVTNGSPNACSILYAAAARAGRAMGYQRIQTYVLAEETGTSLRAAGWTCDGERRGGPRRNRDGKMRQGDYPMGNKVRWSKVLNSDVALHLETALDRPDTPRLL